MIDEFMDLPQVARAAGVACSVPVARRIDRNVDSRAVSALRWGTPPPEVVFLHGNGQNAHTWDATILALGRPALAVDLPGHGHSGWRGDGDYRPAANAAAVSGYLSGSEVPPYVLVGMSLGGLTAIALAAHRPTSIRHLVVVDVTPRSGLRVAVQNANSGTQRLHNVSGDPATFDELVDVVAAMHPTRSRAELRAGVRHNAVQELDGRWRWRADPRRIRTDGRPHDYSELWETVDQLTTPVTLVRAARSGVVPPEDAAEFARRAEQVEVITIDTELHAVQSARPNDLAELIRSRLVTA